MSNIIENVLILQGGGSLGAFGCGVFKSLAENNINIDIVAGTSIGGVNAAIIAGYNEQVYDNAETALEEFWVETAESSPVYLSLVPYTKWFANINDKRNSRILFQEPKKIIDDALAKIDESNKAMLSFFTSIFYGNRKIFLPRWSSDYILKDPEYFFPSKWTYLYDHRTLTKTLEKYIDYNKLQPPRQKNNSTKIRLILTAVNVLTAAPLIFDSHKQRITAKHLLATSAYPTYSLPWIEVERGVYAWDGSLLSNTPLREVIDASPVNDKRIIIVENYPKNINTLPENLPEVYHRARDIIFSDKTLHNVKMSKVITNYIRYIDELYKIIERYTDVDRIDKQQLERIRNKYRRIKKERGAEIKNINYITRDEPFPFIYENADFSMETIKNSIREGESKTNELLNKIEMK
jgi:NTE family protein